MFLSRPLNLQGALSTAGNTFMQDGRHYYRLVSIMSVLVYEMQIRYEYIQILKADIPSNEQ